MSAALLPKRARRPIGLTALIDVVFILLMFFMLTSSFSQWRSLDLQSQAAGKQVDTQPQLLIVHGEDAFSLGALTANTQTLESLAGTLSRSQALVIIPRADISVQIIVSTMTRLKRLGLENISLGNSIKVDQ